MAEGGCLRFAEKVGGQWSTEFVKADTSSFERGTSMLIFGNTIRLACTGKTLNYATREVGITDSQSDVDFVPVGGTTIVTGTLSIPEVSGHGRDGTCVLIAVDGRRAAILGVGPNDVRSLAPGVYFVVPRAAGIKQPSIRKVVIQR
jgi:hypothetical protein